MRINSRFVKSAIKTAQTQGVDMPWTRGTGRKSAVNARKKMASCMRTKAA